MGYTVNEIAGKQFGHLTAIRYDHGGRGTKKSRYKAYWLCRCDCGKECFVERYNLISGKTQSCGHLRSDSIRIHRGGSKRVVLSEKDLRWIIKHYKHTKNQDIKDRFGLTDGWLHRFARENGLKKTTQFVRKCQKGASDAAKVSHTENGTYPPKGYRIPGGEKCGFKPGHKESAKTKEKRIAASSATMKEIRKREKARLWLGLPQKTKLKVEHITRRRAALRYNLRRRGYTVVPRYPKAPDIAYWDDATRRSVIIESRKPNDRGYAAFIFLPASEMNNNQ